MYCLVRILHEFRMFHDICIQIAKNHGSKQRYLIIQNCIQKPCCWFRTCFRSDGSSNSLFFTWNTAPLDHSFRGPVLPPRIFRTQVLVSPSRFPSTLKSKTWFLNMNVQNGRHHNVQNWLPWLCRSFWYTYHMQVYRDN